MSGGQGQAIPKKIVVAVEGSEPTLKESSMKAVGHALGLAVASGASLTALCVVQIPDYVEENTRKVLRDELFAKSRQTLEEVAALALGAGVGFGSEVLETGGSISTAICDFASKGGADLIVLGTRANTSTLSKMMLGSVAAGVVGNADCPVLVVR